MPLALSIDLLHSADDQSSKIYQRFHSVCQQGYATMNMIDEGYLGIGRRNLILIEPNLHQRHKRQVVLA